MITARRNLKRKVPDIKNAIRYALKAFGIKLGKVGRTQFETKLRAILSDDPMLTGLVDGLLRARAVLWVQYGKLHRLVVRIVGRDPLMRRFTSVPGVGPVTALAFRAAVDDPHRLAKSRTVGGHFGLTPRRW